MPRSHFDLREGPSRTVLGMMIHTAYRITGMYWKL